MAIPVGYAIVFVLYCLICKTNHLAGEKNYVYVILNMVDGEAEHYIGLHRRMIIFFVIGIVLEAIGAVCFIIFTPM